MGKWFRIVGEKIGLLILKNKINKLKKTSQKIMFEDLDVKLICSNVSGRGGDN